MELKLVRVWDLPTRVFHWSLALAVCALVLSGETGGEWMVWHFRLGYGALCLLFFRLVWGFSGGYWSRFANFVRGPRAVLNYLREPSPMAIGHNPLGGYSVVAMLLVLLAQATSGLMSDDEIVSAGPLVSLAPDALVRTMTALHTGPVKYALLFLVMLHIAAIAWHRLRHGDHLVGPMLSGDKRVPIMAHASRDDGQTRALAILVFLLCAACVAALLIWVN